MTDSPYMMRQANELRRAFQKGDDEHVLRIVALGHKDGLHAALIHALTHMSEKDVLSAAPYIADLARKLGWLHR